MSEPEDDFASLFEASLQAKRFEEGQTIEGTIVSIGPEVAFVDVGGKGEATIEIEELYDDDGVIDAEVGDRIQAMVVGTAGGLKLSRKLARGAADRRQLEDAFHAGLPVEGKVERAVKGGYEVRIAGQRAFCPISQIDTVRTTEAAEHEGRVYTFRILEFKEGGKNLVVSRRALLEERQREEADAVRRSIVEGAVVAGRVASVREYGAFVELGGGVTGLLHVSDMGWSRVSDPTEIVRPGDEVTVKVLRLDTEKGRISLGLKQLQADPWSKRRRNLRGRAGARRTRHAADGVRRLRRAPSRDRGVGARIHVSADRQARRMAGDGSPRNDRIVRDPERRAREEAHRRRPHRRRHRRASAQASSGEIVPGARLKGKIERHEKFGVFVFLAPGKTGLIPMKETGLQREADLARTFPGGRRGRGSGSGGRSRRTPHPPVPQGGHRRAGEGRSPRVHRAQARDAAESFGSLAEKLKRG